MISDQAKQFHELLKAVNPTAAEPTLEESRAASEGWGLASTEPEGVTFEPVDTGGVPAEWAIPADADPSRALLYLHGGGYTLGSIASHRKLVGHLAKAAGVRGLLIEYRLAPEDPFPAGLDDAVAAYRWLLDQGYAADHVGIGGDSAGGGLALATALAISERGLPAPAGLVLLSPWTDLASTGASITANQGKDLILRRVGPETPQASQYAGTHGVTHPQVSPLYAEFDGFVPFVVHVGSDELLLDDSVRLADKAHAAGCDATIEVWPEMQHVFQIAAGNMPEADSSISKLGAWLSGQMAD